MEFGLKMNVWFPGGGNNINHEVHAIGRALTARVAAAAFREGTDWTLSSGSYRLDHRGHNAPLTRREIIGSISILFSRHRYFWVCWRTGNLLTPTDANHRAKKILLNNLMVTNESGIVVTLFLSCGLAPPTGEIL